MPAHLTVIGKVSGSYGLKGWIKVVPYTRSPGGVLNFRTWMLQGGWVPEDADWRTWQLQEGRLHGKGVAVKLEGCDSPEVAARLAGRLIAVEKAALPVPGQGSYYWYTLEGLGVVNTTGTPLGVVSHLFETASNDVMVVRGERERLIPWTRDVIRHVDVEAGRIEVDWDADF